MIASEFEQLRGSCACAGGLTRRTVAARDSTSGELRALPGLLVPGGVDAVRISRLPAGSHVPVVDFLSCTGS
jgi:hypothetical protein